MGSCDLVETRTGAPVQGQYIFAVTRPVVKLLADAVKARRVLRRQV